MLSVLLYTDGEVWVPVEAEDGDPQHLRREGKHMRKSVHLVALVLAVAAACVPPPPDTSPPTGARSVAGFIDGLAQHNGLTFCIAHVHADFTLRDDTGAGVATWITVTGVGPDSILCEPAGWVVGGTITCDPGCGSVPFTAPLLEQSIQTLTFTRIRPTGARLTMRATGTYFGVNDGGMATLETPPIRCWAAHAVCLFQ